MKNWFWFLVLLISVSGNEVSGSEPIHPVARFAKDSIKVGETVKLSLSVRYQSKLRILMPDTNHVFVPFELIKKEYYPTKTSDGISRDSVVYFLATYALDSIQTLQLPVFQFAENDSTEWISDPVSVRVLQSFKGPLPENPVFQSDNSLISIPLKLNYPYLILGIGILLALILAINFFFNRPIQRFIYLFIERRRHDAYIRQFDRISVQLANQLTIDSMEKLLNIWKKYIQRVDNKPYTTFTSMEIFKVLPDSVLKNALQDIDRWIYGGMEIKDWRSHVEYIKEISLQLYLKRRESIKNGKFE